MRLLASSGTIYVCSQPPGSKIVLCLLGIDGLNVELDEWKRFVHYFQQRQGLKVQLLFGESKIQWKKNQMYNGTR